MKKIETDRETRAKRGSRTGRKVNPSNTRQNKREIQNNNSSNGDSNKTVTKIKNVSKPSGKEDDTIPANHVKNGRSGRGVVWDSEMNKVILKHMLKNAVDFGGRANSRAVLGAVLRERTDGKSNIQEILRKIDDVAQSWEGRPIKEMETRLMEISPELMKPRADKKKWPLKPLPEAVEGKVVVRIAPSPSGALHIGHAYGTSLNYEYARMYGGKLILRIEDTNPENIYPQAYELIEDDARWLTDGGIDKEVVVQSDRLTRYYDTVEKLIKSGNAYVCRCDSDKFRELKNRGEECACRVGGVNENEKHWMRMFGEYAEGEAVVRIKGDIKHRNPAMRDFAIMRIVEHVHPRRGKQNRLWPLMVLAVAIDDHDLGITHVLNGKDHADNALKEKMIMECLGWKPPEYKHWGRINFEGFELSTSKTRIAIGQGAYEGWDDIRLPFMPALRRRGYQPGAFRRFALEMGLSLNDKTVSAEEFWKSINAFNKEIIDHHCRRAFLVASPVRIRVIGAPKVKALLPTHPGFPGRGSRKLIIGEDLFIDHNDKIRLEEGKIHRLMEGYNFVVDKGIFMFHSLPYEDYKMASNKGMIIHYLPADGKKTIEVEVCRPDGSKISGLGEDELLKLPVGDIVQFERCFFAKLDFKSDQKMVFWYLHGL